MTSSSEAIKKIKSICYFGCYDPNYARSRVLIGGLRENGYEVVECHTEESGIRKYFDLFKKIRSLGKRCDMVLVAYPGHDLVWFVKLLTRKPIIFEANYSFYDSYVDDRKLCRRGSLKALYYRFLDWFCSWLPDFVILECETLIDYFVNRCRLPRGKFIKVIMSADDGALFPREPKEKSDKFIVHFHGTFIPFQGIEYIIRAAKLLEKNEDIFFHIIGSGQTSREMEKLIQDLGIKNIRYWGKRIPHNEVMDYIAQADVCMGFFGDTPRARKVMTNKIFEAIAMRKPVITADLPVMREVYTDRQNILFCKSASPQDLAEKILLLKNDAALKNKIAQNAYRLFKEKLSPRVVTKNMIFALESRLCEQK